MSKELPYFRFTAFEWLNDDISLEDYQTKGVFIDVCAYYWFKDCSITKAMLEKRFSTVMTVIELLFESGIIKFRNGDDFIEISFLNKQFDELSELRKQRQSAGSKGGKQRASKAKAKLKQNPSYKDKDKDKDKDIHISYQDFYTSELSKTEDTSYHAFVEWLLGKNEIGRPFTKCLTMQDQIGYPQYLHLKRLSQENGTKISDKIKDLENGFEKYKLKSLNLTLIAWMKRK